jgi:hypothetical protein
MNPWIRSLDAVKWLKSPTKLEKITPQFFFFIFSVRYVELQQSSWLLHTPTFLQSSIYLLTDHAKIWISNHD